MFVLQARIGLVNPDVNHHLKAQQNFTLAKRCAMVAKLRAQLNHQAQNQHQLKHFWEKSLQISLFNGMRETLGDGLHLRLVFTFDHNPYDRLGP